MSADTQWTHARLVDYKSHWGSHCKNLNIRSSGHAWEVASTKICFELINTSYVKEYLDSRDCL